jgi:pyruvate/2-oxoglutarate dehydrogenase complex dihydrolipoamide dehydrogenase (E3) component
LANQHYDLIVIGNGPAGQNGGSNAAKVAKRVARFTNLPVDEL